MKRIVLAILLLPAPLGAAPRQFTSTLPTNLHRFLVNNAPSISEAGMPPYTVTIPGTNVTFRMTPIPGGEFLMGSPTNEAGRKPDEGPQHRVRIEPLWMGVCEVTWNEDEIFLYRARGTRSYTSEDRDPHTNTLADAVAMPTKPYFEMSMGMGREGYPAINMTHHAATNTASGSAPGPESITAAHGGRVGIRLPGWHNQPHIPCVAAPGRTARTVQLISVLGFSAVGNTGEDNRGRSPRSDPPVAGHGLQSENQAPGAHAGRLHSGIP
jgi:hypothetical protein